MSKVSNLTILVVMLFLAVASIIVSEWWKSEPNIYTAVVKSVVTLSLVIVFSIWYYRRSFSSKFAVIVVIPLLVLSTISNSIVVLANGGKMSVDPSLGAAGLPKYYVEGGNLSWLGDCLWMGNSIGDLMLFSGMLLLLVELAVFVVIDSRKVKK